MKMKYLVVVVGIVALGALFIVFTNQSQTSLPSTMPSPTPEVPLVENNSEQTDENISSDVKTAIIDKHGTGESLTISVGKVSGDYAQGSANEEGMGGGMWFAKKVNGEWKLVWDGNGILTCEDISDYPDFPKDMIPKCYDMESETLIDR